MNSISQEIQNQINDWYQNLSLLTLPQIENFYDEKTEFVDPFHHLYSRKELLDLYIKMFRKVKNPKFIIKKHFSNNLDYVVFWDFTFNKFKISGMTHFVFNENGKIIGHYDYWDSIQEFWIKLPLIGLFIRLFLQNFILIFFKLCGVNK